MGSRYPLVLYSKFNVLFDPKKRMDGLFTALLKTHTFPRELLLTKRKVTSFPNSHRETPQNVTQKLEFTQGRGLGSKLLWIKNRNEWKYLAITIHKQFTNMLNGKKKKTSWQYNS